MLIIENSVIGRTEEGQIEFNNFNNLPFTVTFFKDKSQRSFKTIFDAVSYFDAVSDFLKTK